jgi:cysteine/O-acetylserine efflux protein
MSQLELAPLITFIVITTFTPGPNNISSASMGLNFGYARTFPYLTGIVSGAAAVTLSCGLLSGTVLAIVPALAKWLRWFGSAYIFWMAWGILRTNWTINGKEPIPVPLGFLRGVGLQVLNPKLFVFAVSLFSTFLQPLAGKGLPLLASIAALALVNFCSISLWTLFGAALNKHAGNTVIRKGINGVLSALLAYTALVILGI